MYKASMPSEKFFMRNFIFYQTSSINSGRQWKHWQKNGTKYSLNIYDTDYKKKYTVK